MRSLWGSLSSDHLLSVMAKRKSQSSTSSTKRSSNKSKDIHQEEEEEEEEELCPSCPRTKAARQQLQIDSDTTDWVGCEKCNTWHHWACVTPQPAPPIETLAKVSLFHTLQQQRACFDSFSAPVVLPHMPQDRLHILFQASSDPVEVSSRCSCCHGHAQEQSISHS